MDDLTPALRVRARFRAAFFGLPEGMELEDPKRYRAFLQERLEYALVDLARAGSRNASTEAARTAVFVIATGLSTFGELRYVELGLEHVPTRGLVRRLAASLREFLPLPANIDPERDPSAAAVWLRRNRASLKWVPDSHYAWVDETN